mmetsp:Transcript_35586/g.53006  ORF Transcript_35586/g.53006 Transcript_35586/m.53006 type:complete len:229 (-) Transcript_35586:317-1003(-)
MGDLSSQAKVKQLHVAVDIHTDIVWLEVSIDDTLVVQVVNGAGDLVGTLHAFGVDLIPGPLALPSSTTIPLLFLFPFFNLVIQSTMETIQDEEIRVMSSVLEGVGALPRPPAQLQDVWVIKRREELCFDYQICCSHLETKLVLHHLGFQVFDDISRFAAVSFGGVSIESAREVLTIGPCVGHTPATRTACKGLDLVYVREASRAKTTAHLYLFPMKETENIVLFHLLA